ILGRIAAEVVAVERHAELAAAARARLAALGAGNVRIVEGDGSLGLPEAAPFEAILVAASGRHVPRALIDQLAVGGILVVPLGEASHGTSEFYRARAAITRRLIEEHGFSIVAVEADWPDAATIDRYVRHRATREGEDAAFERFPTWMWRNEEVDAFIRWLR